MENEKHEFEQEGENIQCSSPARIEPGPWQLCGGYTDRSDHLSSWPNIIYSISAVSGGGHEKNRAMVSHHYRLQRPQSHR